MNQSSKLLYIIGVIVLLIAGAVFFYFVSGKFEEQKLVNYLIPGVPYHGLYDFQIEAPNPMVTNVLMVLQYYGDERFTDPAAVQELLERFKAQNNARRMEWVKQFFEEIGYKTEDVHDTVFSNFSSVTWIKKFVNEEKKIPILVSQRGSLDPQYETGILRLVIGVFDNEKKVVVHDYYYGNNLELSYKTFENLFVSRYPKIITLLAVWPSDDLMPKLKGIDVNREYPTRVSVMDDIGPVFSGTLTDLSMMKTLAGDDPVKQKEYNEEAIKRISGVINSDYFKEIHPAIRINILSARNGALFNLERYDEIIKSVTDDILPINYGLDKPHNGWMPPVLWRARGGKLPNPYANLGFVYRSKGDYAKAFQSFEKAWEINPTNFRLSQHSNWGMVYSLYKEVYEGALKLDPKNKTALQWKARVEGAR